jgi:hypothetical protein
MRVVCAAALCAAFTFTTLTPTASVAQPSASQLAADAERFFSEGRRAMAAKDYDRACASFRASLEIDRAEGTLLNLALCEESAGRLAKALAWWEEAIEALPDTDKRRAVAIERRAALLPRVPELTIDLGPNVPGDARLSIDGSQRPARSVSGPQRLDPGEHTIELHAPGRRPNSVRVVLLERDRREVVVSLGAELSDDTPATAAPPTAGNAPATSTAAPPRTADAPSSSQGRRVAGWIVGGIGLVGLAAAGVTGGLLLARDGRIRDACPDKQCTDSGREEIDGAAPWLVANAVAWAVGITGVGVGAVLVLTSGGGAGRPASRGAVLSAAGEF